MPNDRTYCNDVVGHQLMAAGRKRPLTTGNIKPWLTAVHKVPGSQSCFEGTGGLLSRAYVYRIHSVNAAGSEEDVSRGSQTSGFHWRHEPLRSVYAKDSLWWPRQHRHQQPTITGKNWLNFGNHLPPNPEWFRNFSKDSSILHFPHNLAYISGESDWIFMKILSQMYPKTRKSPLSYGSNTYLKSVSRLRIQTIFSLANIVCGQWLLLYQWNNDITAHCCDPNTQDMHDKRHSC